MAVNDSLSALNVSGVLRPPPKKNVPKPKIPVVPKGPGKGGPRFDDPLNSIKQKAAADATQKQTDSGTGGGGATTGTEEGDAKANADALATLQMMLESWGLSELTNTVIGMIQQDYSTNQILLELRKSDAYKKRFSGNEARIKNGYAALEPSDYLQVEDAYQRILQSAGLPKGFYDDPSDFAGWIGSNVSASEISERVGYATDAVNNTDPNYLDALGRMGLAHGDLIANMLDQNRALPILRKTVGTAKLGAASLRAGLGFDQDRVSKYYSLLADANGGIDSQFANQAYSTVAAALPRANSLSNMYGEQVDQGTLEDEFLGRNELASQKRKRLANLELAQYKGSGGLGDKALGQSSRGEY